MDVLTNGTDDPADIPSLGIFGVPPGESVEVPDGKAFDGSEIWQTAKTHKPKHKPKTEENPK